MLFTVEFLNEQMISVDVQVGAQLIDGDMIGVDGTVGKRRLVENVIAQPPLAQENGVEIEFFNERFAIGVVVALEGINEELIVGSAVDRSAIGSDVEVDELTGVKYKMV